MNMKHKPLLELRIKCVNQELIHVIYTLTRPLKIGLPQNDCVSAEDPRDWPPNKQKSETGFVKVYP